uniref:Uncharacterized protein n=1 Tax=Chaetoceros debilis TaxID=122233 RepID=A0A7S3PWT8_9STRA
MNSIVAIASILCLLFAQAECFQIASSSSLKSNGLSLNRQQRSLVATCTYAKVSGDNDDGGDFKSTTPGEDNYESDIDWDAEWKKVVETKGQDSSSRPGKDFYKNDVQRAAAKASRQASDQISKVKIVKPDINIRSLQGDPKFWIGMLALISIGLALATAPDMSSYSNSNESFYI